VRRNQALQPTADRRTNLLVMASTLNSAAQLSLSSLGDILPPMIVAIVACAVALTAVLLSALLTLSRLIRHEYQFHRESGNTTESRLDIFGDRLRPLGSAVSLPSTAMRSYGHSLRRIGFEKIPQVRHC
jgi:hypothetical protein